VKRQVRDVLIIGSGAGGGPLALRLSQAGLDVLVLEKGPHYRRADYRHDEVAMATHRGFFVPKVSDEPHVVVDGTDSSVRARLTTLGWTACCVGGGTAHMGAALYRFHPDDFRVRSRLGSFESVADWPYAYDELEPYYAIAEREIGVAGVGGLTPVEGPRSAPFPMPPLRSHPIAGALDDACATLGVHAFPTPRGINSRPYGGRPACTFCDFCAGFGCPTGARGSTQEALLSRAQQTGRCEIRALAMVRAITTDHRGQATGCLYLDADGGEHEIRARVVCVCCSAVESARLLLLSSSSRFPDGLANGSGMVGRNLQFHTGSAARGRFRYDRHSAALRHDRNPFIGRSVMDYYFLPGGVSPFAKGGLLRFDFERQTPIARAQRIARTTSGYVWGAPLRKRLREHFCDYRDVELEVFHDFVPNDATFVSLDPRVRDKWGLPVARIALSVVDHHRRAGEWLVDRGREILDAMGADESAARDIGYVTDVMAHGTCRSGSDPCTSVVDPFCRAHEVPNLFVVDGSFMPTSGGAPSTLTILANSFRSADHILGEARRGSL
jgi:choline dehydrogenase-like flavoprotein